MDINRREQGRRAEDEAAEFLRSKGMTIVTRRFKCRAGELDLIALDGELLVFVEVKQRLSGGNPEESVGPKKRAQLHKSANEYLEKMGEPAREYRIDLVAIDASGIRHYPGAFTDSWDM